MHTVTTNIHIDLFSKQLKRFKFLLSFYHKITCISIILEVFRLVEKGCQIIKWCTHDLFVLFIYAILQIMFFILPPNKNNIIDQYVCSINDKLNSILRIKEAENIQILDQKQVYELQIIQNW